MSIDTLILRNREIRDRDIEGFLDVLELHDDVGLALEAIGRTYTSFRRTLVGAGRHDLVEKLSEWRAKDIERLNYALGRARK